MKSCLKLFLNDFPKSGDQGWVDNQNYRRVEHRSNGKVTCAITYDRLNNNPDENFEVFVTCSMTKLVYQGKYD